MFFLGWMVVLFLLIQTGVIPSSWGFNPDMALGWVVLIWAGVLVLGIGTRWLFRNERIKGLWMRTVPLIEAYEEQWGATDSGNKFLRKNFGQRLGGGLAGEA